MSGMSYQSIMQSIVIMALFSLIVMLFGITGLLVIVGIAALYFVYNYIRTSRVSTETRLEHEDVVDYDAIEDKRKAREIIKLLKK